MRLQYCMAASQTGMAFFQYHEKALGRLWMKHAR